MGSGGAEPPRGLGRDWAYDASPGKPCSVSGFLSSVAVAAVVEPQVPKAPAAPEADVPPIHTSPNPPFSTVRIFITWGCCRTPPP